jgi:hypothetical protein
MDVFLEVKGEDAYYAEYSCIVLPWNHLKCLPCGEPMRFGLWRRCPRCGAGWVMLPRLLSPSQVRVFYDWPRKMLPHAAALILAVLLLHGGPGFWAWVFALVGRALRMLADVL